MAIDINLPAPSPKQRLFMEDTHRHVAFGGARGGGKSFALREKAILLCARHAGIVVTIVRKTYSELMSNHIKPLCAMLHIGQKGNPIKYNDSRKEITFPNGSQILFRYCDIEKDVERFQGSETHILMLDECTLLSKEQLDALNATVRSADDLPKRTYWTCNPNGQSMGYVKRLFIDRKFEGNERPEDYSFIQSLVTDNKALMKSNPEYIRQLETLPPKMRAAWLEGRWDVYEGMYFEEWREKPDAIKCEEAGISEEQALAEHRWTHVVPSFTPPKSWRIFRAYDWGYGKPFSVLWLGLSEDDTAYVIAELYGCTRTPNEGVHWTNKQQADEIQRIEREHPWLRGHEIRGWADPSIWDGSHDTYGISCAEEMEKHQIWFDRGNNERIAGWMQVRERLKFDENGYAKLYVFDDCRQLIRCFPLQMYDEHKPEDMDSDLEDHCLDSLRYFCMGRPIPPRLIEVEEKPICDPLNQFATNQGKYKRYNALKGL